MRRLWLALTDPRVKAALAALDRSGPALGDLLDHPELAVEFFPPLRKTIAKAAALPGKRPAAFRALLAAEDLVIRLERVFSDMARLEARPEALPHALRPLQQACALAPRLLGEGSGPKTLAEAMALCGAGRKILAQARTAAERDPGEFTQNLKFSSIYSGLDAVFDSFERCAQALSRI